MRAAANHSSLITVEHLEVLQGLTRMGKKHPNLNVMLLVPKLQVYNDTFKVTWAQGEFRSLFCELCCRGMFIFNVKLSLIQLFYRALGIFVINYLQHGKNCCQLSKVVPNLNMYAVCQKQM